eukprot:12212360-Alexandrium_andersonii.AAC.1
MTLSSVLMPSNSIHSSTLSFREWDLRRQGVCGSWNPDMQCARALNSKPRGSPAGSRASWSQGHRTRPAEFTR